jgi:preprotein translocase subunit SecY
MFSIADIGNKFPSVIKPEQKLTLREKLKWTLIILLLFYILGSITAWGVNPSAVSQFEFLEIVFGSKFGSLITLGIGPIVTASIILQLLVGSKILNWDLQDQQDKAKFMGTQKVLAIAFSFIEAIAYVTAGAVPPASADLFTITAVILQIAAGGIIIIFMDEVVSKWGIGSGISLFIAAGVSKTIFVRIFAPPIGGSQGGVIASFIYALSQGELAAGIFTLLPLIATGVVFALVTYAQGINVEIPMSFAMPFGRLGSRRWPLKFLYTSNIPVILVAAVIANMQVLGRVLYSRGISLLGTFDQSGRPASGLSLLLSSPGSTGSSSALPIYITTILASVFALLFAFLAMRMWKKYILRFSILGAILGAFISVLIINIYSLTPLALFDVLHILVYMSAFVIGSMIFSIFWVSTAGMDAKSVADQFKSASIVIPGFRHDPRIIEKVLDKYIPALTIMGGAFVGFLAGIADLTNAIGTGTGLLLTVMIIYQFYEQIIGQHYDEIPDRIKKLVS